MAAIGNASAGGSGSGSSGSTKPAKTEAPKATEAAKKTETPKATEKTEATKAPSKEKIYCVNFGADKSSPQLDTATLTLSAEGYDGAEPYTYEFYIDDKVVQKASKKDSYKWENPEAGEHVIKMVMTDADGQETVKLKKYVIETEGNDTVTNPAPSEPEKTTKPETSTKPEKTTKPTATAKVTEKPGNSPKPTATLPAANKPSETEKPSASAEPSKKPQGTSKPSEKPSETVAPTKKPSGNDEALSVTLTTNKKSGQVIGTEIKLDAKAEGGSGNYTYHFVVNKKDGSNKTAYLNIDSEKASVVWKTKETGTYSIEVSVTDTETGFTETATKTFKIVNKKVLTFKSFTVNKKKVSRKKKVTLTALAVSGKGAAQYQFYYKKKGAKKAAIIYNFGTDRKVSWRVPAKTGVYYVYCKAKDSTGKSLTKKVTIKVVK